MIEIREITHVRDDDRGWPFTFFMRADRPGDRAPAWAIMDEIHTWCLTNCTGGFWVHQYEISFKNQDDAFAFKLRWVSKDVKPEQTEEEA